MYFAFRISYFVFRHFLFQLDAPPSSGFEVPDRYLPSLLPCLLFLTVLMQQAVGMAFLHWSNEPPPSIT